MPIAAPPMPVAIAVTITSVQAPPGFAPPGAVVPDDATGLRNDLKAAEIAASRAHVALVETPVLTLSAAEGVPAVAVTRTSLVFAVPAARAGTPDGAFQTLSLDSRLSVTARRLPSGFLRVKIAFTDTHALGPAWRELGPPQSESVSGSLEDTFKPGDTVFIAKIPAQSPTGRFYYATVSVLPPPKG